MIEIENPWGKKEEWPWDWRGKKLTDETLTKEIRLEIVRGIPKYVLSAGGIPRNEASEGFRAYCKVAEDYFECAVKKAPPSLKGEFTEIESEASRVLDLFHKWVGWARLGASVPSTELPYLNRGPYSFFQLRDHWNAVVERLDLCMGRGQEKKKHATPTGTEAKPVSDTPQNMEEGKVQGSNVPPSVEPIPVDEAKQKACAGGKWFDVTPRQMEIITKLNENPGAWASGASLKSQPGSEERPDQIIKRLPAPLFKRIESRKGAGYGYRLI